MCTSINAWARSILIGPQFFRAINKKNCLPRLGVKILSARVYDDSVIIYVCEGFWSMVHSLNVKTKSVTIRYANFLSADNFLDFVKIISNTSATLHASTGNGGRIFLLEYRLSHLYDFVMSYPEPCTLLP